MRGGTVQIIWHDGQPVLSLDFHPVSGVLATSGADHDIKIWCIATAGTCNNLPTTSYQSSLSFHTSAVNALRFSPSGECLASGADGGDVVIWKLQSTSDAESWKVMKSLKFHSKDVLDLQWSMDGAFLISGSVDNKCLIWDVNKGSVHQMLDDHLHYVQGVAWDPLGQYVASLSSDRTCRIYKNKPQAKSKGFEKFRFVSQHTLVKSDCQNIDDSKPAPAKTHLFHDETLPSFFRRLAWSPEGSFLLLPAGAFKYSPSSEVVNTAYIVSRKDLSRIAINLPGASKPVVAVCFCPVLFRLLGSDQATFFKLPYRVIFAVATLNSLYVYDTQSIAPIAIYAGLHYAAITDIAWSADAKFLALSSRDGYCSIIEFENGELGEPYNTSDAKVSADYSAHPSNLVHASLDLMDVDSPVVGLDNKKDDNENIQVRGSESSLQPVNNDTDVSSKKPTRKRITPTAVD